MSLTKNPEKHIIPCPMEVLAWCKKSSSRYDRIWDMYGTDCTTFKTSRKVVLDNPSLCVSVSECVCMYVCVFVCVCVSVWLAVAFSANSHGRKG